MNLQAFRGRRAGGACLTLALAAGLAPPAEAIDRRVRIVNDSTRDLVAFHRAYSGTDEWGENLLGQGGILRPGKGVILDFADGSGYCRFGFRATFDDGVELVKNGVNICEIGTYRYTD